MATLAFMFTHPAGEDIGINVMAYGQRSQRYATSQILRHQFCFELRTVTPAPANLLGIVLCHYKHPLIISWVLSLAYFDAAEKMPSPDAYIQQAFFHVLSPLETSSPAFYSATISEPSCIGRCSRNLIRCRRCQHAVESEEVLPAGLDHEINPLGPG